MGLKSNPDPPHERLCPLLFSFESDQKYIFFRKMKCQSFYLQQGYRTLHWYGHTIYNIYLVLQTFQRTDGRLNVKSLEHQPNYRYWYNIQHWKKWFYSNKFHPWMLWATSVLAKWKNKYTIYFLSQIKDLGWSASNLSPKSMVDWVSFELKLLYCSQKNTHQK